MDTFRQSISNNSGFFSRVFFLKAAILIGCYAGASHVIVFAQTNAANGENKMSAPGLATSNAPVLHIQGYTNDSLFGTAFGWHMSTLSGVSNVQLIAFITEVSDPTHPKILEHQLEVTVNGKGTLQFGFDGDVPSFSSQEKLPIAIGFKTDADGTRIDNVVSLKSLDSGVLKLGLHGDDSIDTLLSINKPLRLATVVCGSGEAARTYEFSVTISHAAHSQ